MAKSSPPSSVERRTLMPIFKIAVVTLQEQMGSVMGRCPSSNDSSVLATSITSIQTRKVRLREGQVENREAGHPLSTPRQQMYPSRMTMAWRPSTANLVSFLAVAQAVRFDFSNGAVMVSLLP